MSKVSALVVLAIGLASVQQAFPSRVTPVDEGAQDPSFAGFRSDLLAATKQGDLQAVLLAFDPKVTVTGNRIGVSALKREWHVAQSPKRVFAEVQAIFSLGGRFVAPNTFSAPYPATEVPDPPSGHSISEYTVVVRPNATVFASARIGSNSVATLSEGDVVRHNAVLPGWDFVWLPDGREGYVKADSTRAPVDTRAVVTLEGKQWRITEFTKTIE